MESLSMKTLVNSLPISANAASEKQLMDNFKAAALSITTLYRSSLDASKQAYSSGYVACLKDILQFVQAGVCTVGDGGGGGQEEGHGMMTIGRVMDWVEARLEAIKCTDEEEEEERVSRDSIAGAASGYAQQRSKDDKEKDSKRKQSLHASQNMTNAATQQTREGPLSSSAFSKARSNKGAANKESMADSHTSRHSHSVSPAPPNLPYAATIISSPSPPPQSGLSLRSSARSKRGAATTSPIISAASISSYPQSQTSAYHESPQSNSGTIVPPSMPSTFVPEVVTAFPPLSVSTATTVAGTKRRHAMIAAAFAAGGAVGVNVADATGIGGGGTSSHSSTNSANGSAVVSHSHLHGRGPRRRGYHGRGKVANDNALQLQNGFDTMDVEEDGRERKRIARR